MSVCLLPQGADLEPLAAIHASCFADAWNAPALRDLLAGSGTFVVSSRDGFILARTAAGEAEILTLAVLPDARRRGVARALVTEAASHAQSLGAEAMFLEVAVSNTGAQALYARLGFTASGRRKGYYVHPASIPEDALILRSNLPLSPLGKSLPAG